MFRIHIDVRQFLPYLDDVGKRQIPFATMQALNQTMYHVHAEWGQEIGKVFDRPTPLTRRAMQYKKATKENLVAEVFLREDATKGTPPVKYLEHEVEGTTRPAKPFEKLLRAAGVLGANEYVVPARGFPLDAYGNVPQRVSNRILSDLQASRDPQRRSTRESRARRARRRDISKRAVYFYWRGDSGQGRMRHKLPRGIYERVGTRFGSAVRMAFAIVQGAPSYRVRFDAYAVARKIFDAHFAANFSAHLKRAIASAKP